MDTLNKKYNIEITVLSPLAIGAGAEKDWVKGMDFVVKDNQIYLLNLKKMQEAGIDLATLTIHFANKEAEAVKMLIGNKLDAVSDKKFDLPVSLDNNTNDIKSFIKNELSGKPIIPGSSLKGAVRSVILEYLLGNKRLNDSKDEKLYFGDSNKGDELMRFIKFSDAEFEDTALVNTKIFNLHGIGTDWQGGWKHAFRGDTNPATTTSFRQTGFNTIYEVLLPNQKSDCSIMLSETAFDNIEQHSFKEEKKALFSIHELFNIINQHTYNYIGKEIDFFKKYNQAENAQKIINNLTAISNQIPDEDENCNSCILKMSAGSGFHSITGDWQYEDYSKTGIGSNGKLRYKSRKVAVHNDRFFPMGFVKLTIKTQ
jgi:CRISPR-associated protein Csm5